MNERLDRDWEEGLPQVAGEASLERSERSERSGSEASPALHPAEGSNVPEPPEVDELPAQGALEATDEEPVETSGTCSPPEEGNDLSDTEWETAPPPLPPNLTARRRGTLAKPQPEREPRLSPQQKLLLLDTWQRSGLPARDFGALVHISRHTLYAWKRRFELLGPAGLVDQPRGARRGSRLPELTKRAILMLKQAHPEWGCQRISDMLWRGPALPASPSAVARVLHEAGYELVEQPTRPHPAAADRSFERSHPNQLWQTDLFTFVLKRQNRRVYLVGFMDDHSRFITGFGLYAGQATLLVLEVLRAAISAYGVPAEILTDNGTQYVTWRGKSQFTRELEKLGIRQIVARPKRPQTLGKIERFWGTLWRECVEAAVFRDLADARQRIGLFIDYYNFQRVHSGIEGLVPADRFFHAAPEVLKTLRERVAANALELARHGVPKKPFYLTGQLDGQPFSVHRQGDRVILHQAGQQGEEIELVSPPLGSSAEQAREELPRPVCPDGSPETRLPMPPADLPPGMSPVDDLAGDMAVATDADLDLPAATPSADQARDSASDAQPGGDL